MTTLLTTGTALSVRSCPACGVEYALPEQLVEQRRRDGGDWYCPNGHSLVFKETAEQKLRRELETARQQRDRARARATATSDQLAAAERSRSALRGVNTRMRNRIAAGVCPCCSRTFQNLAEHMAGQHPGYAEAPDGA
jgi:uncharacterized Zn finger protein (UPF0148 family)